jgi:hypothetical protein
MAPLPPDEHRMRPDHSPTPFSAEQIREACAPGRVNVYLIEERDAEPVLLRWEFVAGDADSAEAVYQTVTEDGTAIGEAARSTSRWADLQAHASHPADTTEIVEGAVTVPAGTFECWRYAVRDGTILSTSWFAKDLPGPPVLKVDRVDGETVATMTLQEVILPDGST